MSVGDVMRERKRGVKPLRASQNLSEMFPRKNCNDYDVQLWEIITLRALEVE